MPEGNKMIDTFAALQTVQARAPRTTGGFVLWIVRYVSGYTGERLTEALHRSPVQDP